MNDKSLDDLLSASFDGEATPEERAAAERLLETSDEARQEWHELRRLSELLRERPRRSAPPELAAAVMQQAERQTLLANLPGTGRRRPRAGGWLVVLGGLAATAAALLLMSGLFTAASRKPHGEESLARRSAESSLPPSDGMVAARERNSVRNEQAADREDIAPPPSPPATFDARRAMSERDDAAPPVAAPLSGSGVEAAAATPARPDAESLMLRVPGEALAAQDWGRMEIGRVVRFIETSGDQVMVVELTVVDVHRALDSFQILLQRNAIPQMPATRPGQARADAAKLDAGPGATQLAVYVEATESQLASALEEVQRSIRKNDLFREMAPQTTVAPEAFAVAFADGSAPHPSNEKQDVPQQPATLEHIAQEVRRQRVAGQQEQTDSAEGVQDTEGQPAAKSNPGRNQPTAPREAAPPAEAPAESARRAEPRSDALRERHFADVRAQQAFQLVLNVPPQVSRTEPAVEQEADPADPDVPTVRGDRKQAGQLDKKAADVAVSRAAMADPPRPAPLRVIFVFRDTKGRPLPN